MLVTVIVLDSVGVGELPDAALFGDAGAHTLNHTLEAHPVSLPHLTALGLGNIATVTAVPTTEHPTGAYGRMREVSPGKDTTTGHWEFMGVELEHAFKSYPDGFAPEIMAAFDRATGRGHLCNKPYSGTEVIKDYGAEHLATGFPIVYTSADSVFQIAAHEDVVPLETLYEWCEAARELLQGEHAVARVIARPFRGSHPFERAGEHRKDYSLQPPHNVLDVLAEQGTTVVGIGKIPDIYAHRGFSEEIHTDNNADGIVKTIARMRQGGNGLIMTNLVDFDAKWGHRRNPEGYSEELARFDKALPEILAAIPKDGLLIIISDHGNDPTWHGTDHTREHGLLLVAGATETIKAGALPDRASFADVGATVAEALGVHWNGAGESFLAQVRSHRL